jgi:hypothetical protein
VRACVSLLVYYILDITNTKLEPAHFNNMH